MLYAFHFVKRSVKARFFACYVEFITLGSASIESEISNEEDEDDQDEHGTHRKWMETNKCKHTTVKTKQTMSRLKKSHTMDLYSLIRSLQFFFFGD